MNCSHDSHPLDFSNDQNTSLSGFLSHIALYFPSWLILPLLSSHSFSLCLLEPLFLFTYCSLPLLALTETWHFPKDTVSLRGAAYSPTSSSFPSFVSRLQGRRKYCTLFSALPKGFIFHLETQSLPFETSAILLYPLKSFSLPFDSLCWTLTHRLCHVFQSPLC